MKRIGYVFLILFSLFPTLIVSTAKVRADNIVPPTLNYEEVNMENDFRYLIKRVKEKVTVALLSYNPQKKLSYYERLLNIRLAELKYIVDHKDIANIQVSSQRYFTTAGQLTEFLKSKNKLTSNKEKVIKLFAGHIQVIESLKTAYPNTTAEWRFLRDDANYLIDYSNLLK